MTFRSIECSVCHSSQVGTLFRSDRFPSLEVCWNCIHRFQTWVYSNMGSEYVYAMAASPTHNLIKEFAVNGMFLVDTTTATSVQ